jgi:hypothetical protein
VEVGSGSPEPEDGRREGGQTLLERAGSAAAGIGDVQPGHPALRAAMQWGVAALIFGFLVVFVLRQWSKLPDFDWHFSPGWLVLSAVAVFAFYLSQGDIWPPIVRSLGEHIPARPARAVWGKSLIARYVPTNALMIVGRVVMADRHGVAKRVTLASIVYELALGFGTALMVCAYFVIQLPSLDDQPARYVVLAIVPIVLVGLHPRVFAPMANFGLRKLGREPLPRVMPFAKVIQFALMYVGTWAIIGVGVYAFARSLYPLDASDFPYVASAYPVAFCVAVLTFIVPSGLGTRDAALATAMTAVLPGTVATAIAVAFRIFQTVIELIYVGTVASMGRNAERPEPKGLGTRD